MATTEEKQELVDQLSGPRYYRISLNGYGGESAYLSISKEAHDFWKDHTEQYGDSDLVNYMLNAEDQDFDFEELEGVPTEAEFLTDDEGDPRPWFEAQDEYEHSYGATYSAAWISVDEVDSDDYMSNVVAEVISQMDVTELVDEIQEESDYEIDGTDFTECYAGKDVKYIAQMYSSEKGNFFDGIIETHGDFDPKKLNFMCGEYDNGEETIIGVEYDGVEIDNQGGDTNGKGYYAAVWENA